MTYTVFYTETNQTAVTFETKEQAEEWIKERDWDCIDSKFELVEEN
jgi:hypothetical protein